MPRRNAPATLSAFLLAMVSCGAPASDDGTGGAGSSPSGEASSYVVALEAFDPTARTVQGFSLLGDTLVTPDLPPDVFETYLARYQEARAALERAPENVDSLIWMGRRIAYLGHYRLAIGVYTHAASLHPNDARIYRHRGHRYLTVRALDRAIADFERAAELTRGQPDEVEPDGLPNALGIPTSTLQFNTWYHLGLAHYVKGDLEAALEAYRSCLAVSEHPDSVVATSYWLYMTLRRLGREAAAAEVLAGIDEGMDIIESTAYLNLLLLFEGERTLDDPVGPAGSEVTLQSTTTAYGIGVWHLLSGREDEARRTFQRILEGRGQWAAFGYLAAEGEVARGM